MVATPFASYTDANSFLDETKLKFADDGDALPEATNADRIIRALLTPEFPDHVPHWNDGTPEDEPVPALVTTIAGMLMAAYRYSKKYSEETGSESQYANTLKTEAMALLMKIATGELSLYDTDYADDARLTEPDFWPNDTTTVQSTDDFSWAGMETGDPLRAFSMDKEF